MIDYQHLKPGLYVQTTYTDEHGDPRIAIKGLEVALEAWRSNEYSHAPEGAESLASSVAWVFVALERRKQRLSEIPFVWRETGEDVARMPFSFATRDLVPRIDEALQLYKVAYLLKQRNMRGEMIGVRWLDPMTIKPKLESAVPGQGVTVYKRTGPKAGGGTFNDDIPASDLMVFEIPGMRELGPGTPAGRATSFAAQILYGIQQTADSVYDNNALPAMLINVPADTLESDKKTIEQRFRDFFNPRKKGSKDYRVTAVSRPTGDRGVEVMPLTIAPKDLAMPELSNDNRDQVLAGHGVPLSEALSNASSRETSNANDTSRFTIVMGTRFEWLAEKINDDPDVRGLDLELVVMYNRHWSMRYRELAAAQTFSTLLTGMTPRAAGHMAGIVEDDFPEEIRAEGIYRDVVGSSPFAPSAPAGGQNAETNGSLKTLLTDLEKWERKAVKAFKAGDRARLLEDFTASTIPENTRALIVDLLEEAQSVGEIQKIFSYREAVA